MFVCKCAHCVGVYRLICHAVTCRFELLQLLWVAPFFNSKVHKYYVVRAFERARPSTILSHFVLWFNWNVGCELGGRVNAHIKIEFMNFNTYKFCCRFFVAVSNRVCVWRQTKHTQTHRHDPTRPDRFIHIFTFTSIAERRTFFSIQSPGYLLHWIPLWFFRIIHSFVGSFAYLLIWSAWSRFRAV